MFDSIPAAPDGDQVFENGYPSYSMVTSSTRVLTNGISWSIYVNTGKFSSKAHQEGIMAKTNQGMEQRTNKNQS
jgi:hypothetical protein